jgi:HK97 family phage major capsid protein
MATNANAPDDFIRRIEGELREKDTFAKEIFAKAEAAQRDLTDSERELLSENRSRMEKLKLQLEEAAEHTKATYEYLERCKQVDLATRTQKGQVDRMPVEYRSAGEYMLDLYKNHLGDRDATERLELWMRTADHQKTSDNLGVIPDPVVGDLVNFVDNARPIVTSIGPRPLPSATWHRPVVTQLPAVGVQGSAGAAADEKVELVSQKMTITKINASAITYGGYLNVSRQNLDFSQPQILDIINEGLAGQYAQETEAAAAAELAATTATPISAGSVDAAGVSGAIWEAAAAVYTAVKNQGSLRLAVAPDVMRTVGALYPAVNPQSSQSAGFTAGNFSQGILGSISGISVLVSAQLAAGEAFLFSTAAIECYEQRGGQLSVVEPSVLGLQVAYYGYFTPLTLAANGIVPITGLGAGS